jgi:hypothetical protein
MAKTLQLNFATASGKNLMLTVDEPRENLTSVEVESAMQGVINAGVFGVDDGVIESAISARIVERTVTELIEG